MSELNLIDHVCHTTYLESAEFTIEQSNLSIKTGGLYARHGGSPHSCFMGFKAIHDVAVNINTEHCNYSLVVGLETSFDDEIWDGDSMRDISDLQPKFFLDRDLILGYSASLDLFSASADRSLAWLNGGSSKTAHTRDNLLSILPCEMDMGDREQQLRFAIVDRLNKMLNCDTTPKDVQRNLLCAVGMVNGDWLDENLTAMQVFAESVSATPISPSATIGSAA